jgi:anti-sigma B factor antagonist
MNENAVMSRTISPRLLVETVEGITIASFTDEMITSEEVIWEVDEQLMSLVDGPSPEKLLLNFREVRVMSSTMLAILLKLARKIKGVQGELKLCGLSPDLLEIFRISRFDRLFEIHDEEWTALDAF